MGGDAFWYLPGAVAALTELPGRGAGYGQAEADSSARGDSRLPQVGHVSIVKWTWTMAGEV